MGWTGSAAEPRRPYTGVIPVSTPDMVRWISDRFAGMANPDPYPPSGATDGDVSSCTD